MKSKFYLVFTKAPTKGDSITIVDEVITLRRGGSVKAIQRIIKECRGKFFVKELPRRINAKGKKVFILEIYA